MNSNNPLNVTHDPSAPQAYPDPASNLQFYTNFSGRSQVWHEPWPISQFRANDPQPSLSLDRLGSDCKRRADGEQQWRRVRSGAPPPQLFDLSVGANSDAGSTPLAGRHWVGNGEKRCSWEKEGEEQGRALQWAHSSPQADVGAIPSSAASGKPEWNSLGRKDVRRRETSKQFPAFQSSLLPEIRGTPPRRSGKEASDPSLSPRMYGTPPWYSGIEAAPRLGYAKRKRSEDEDAEDDEAHERSKRIQNNATYVKEMRARMPKPQQVPVAAMDASSSRLPELDATIPILPYSGLKLGQLLPCGEILGFAHLPPLAQLYDIYSTSLVQPHPSHAWIQQTWRAIHTSVGTRAPTWQHNYWHEEIDRSGTAHAELAFRAIKTFRELGEKLWRADIVELRDETLGLFRKEMDYTVLLLLVHRYDHDRMLWEQRLKMLFARLDPAFQPRNITATPAPTAAFDAQRHYLGAAPLLPMSGLPVLEEEQRVQFAAWPSPPPPSAQGPIAQGAVAVKEEPMDDEP